MREWIPDPIDALDAWLRGEFVRINTRLEEAYFAEPHRRDPRQAAARRPQVRVAAAGWPARGARCRLWPRFRLTRGRATACSASWATISRPASATRLRSAMKWARERRPGPSPCGSAAHSVSLRASYSPTSRSSTMRSRPLSHFHVAAGREVFIRWNALAVLAYQRAAMHCAALRRSAYPAASPRISSSRPRRLARRAALQPGAGRELDVARFYFNIRPYFKTYRVGSVDYRGANAGTSPPSTRST